MISRTMRPVSPIRRTQAMGVAFRQAVPRGADVWKAGLRDSERRASMEIRLRTVFEDSHLRITVRDAAGGRGIVAFTGIGSNLGSLPQEEFVATLAEMPDAGPIFFVVDKARSWYNDVREDPASLINSALAHRNVAASVAIGNSMGGFGAIAYGPRIETCTRIVAFSPQYSVKADIVPFERRWRAERSAIARWTVPTACGHPNAPDLVLVAGGRSARDLKHVELIRSNYGGRSTTLLAPLCDHNVPAALKRASLLRETVEALLLGPEDEIERAGATLRSLEPAGRPAPSLLVWTRRLTMPILPRRRPPPDRKR